MICTGLPVVSCPYMPAAEIPMPCWPRLMRSRWNLDPYRSFANIGGICWRMMPGPLSATVIRKRLAWLGGSGGSPLATASTLTTTSGRIPASSQASRALSTASLTQVSSAFRGLSKPRRCRFLVKNSDTEISRCRAPISTAETGGVGFLPIPPHTNKLRCRDQVFGFAEGDDRSTGCAGGVRRIASYRDHHEPAHAPMDDAARSRWDHARRSGHQVAAHAAAVRAGPHQPLAARGRRRLGDRGYRDRTPADA